MIRQTQRVLGAAVLMAVLASGCGGGGEDSAAKVASLGGGSTTTAKSSSKASQTDFQDVMLEYAACMRKHGVDMADPQFDSDGRPIRSDSGGGARPDGGMRDDPDFADAQTACRDIMQSAQGQFQQDTQQQADMQKNLLAFAKCMRKEGVDYPDPQFDADGRPVFDSSQDGRMTFNNDDPTFKAASEACQKKLGDTFRPMGGGAPPDAGGAQGGGK